MSATVGLERLPGTIASLLDAATCNLLAAANELDTLVHHGGPAPLRAIEDHETEGDRIVHDLADALRASRRVGPDRERLLTLAQAIDDVVDALHELAWWWTRHASPPLADMMRTIRDTARAAAATVSAIDDPNRRPARITRCRDRERTARSEIRRACAALTLGPVEPRQAIGAHAVIERAESCLTTCARLRAEAERNALA